MARGGKTETKSGLRVDVFETFILTQTSVERAIEAIGRFNFGKGVRMPEITGPDGGDSWRMEVIVSPILVGNAVVVGVQVCYNGLCKQRSKMSVQVSNVCLMDAENSVFKPIDNMLSVCDLFANPVVGAPAPAPEPAPALAPAPGGHLNP